MDTVLNEIKRHAFTKSDYPLIISLDVRCNKENRRAAADLMATTFGETLLRGPLSADEQELPSPEKLKGKILLKAKVDLEVINEEKEGDDEVEFFIGRVWFKGPDEWFKGSKWELKDLIWGKESLTFVTPKSQILVELCEKPYFVGHMKRENMEKFMKEAEEKTNGSFLVFCNEAYTEFMMSVVYKRDQIIHFPLAYDDKNKKYFFATNQDREQKFDTIDKLVAHFSVKSLTLGLAKLTEPFDLTGNEILKYLDWFYGDLDQSHCSELMETVRVKGAFLVRDEETDYTRNYVIEFFDGHRAEQVKVEENHAGGELLVLGHTSFKARTIIEVVN